MFQQSEGKIMIQRTRVTKLNFNPMLPWYENFKCRDSPEMSKCNCINEVLCMKTYLLQGE